jgi:hypothetical protein
MSTEVGFLVPGQENDTCLLLVDSTKICLPPLGINFRLMELSLSLCMKVAKVSSTWNNNFVVLAKQK